MMMQRFFVVIGLGMLGAFLMVVQAQESSTATDCSTTGRAAEQQRLIDMLSKSDLQEGDLFKAGLLAQEFALACGYKPSEDEASQQIALTLALSDLQTIIKATSVGTDVEAVVAKLDSAYGDSFNGQLLFNTIEDGLDGSPLGCVGCHDGQTAPNMEGVWTRTTEKIETDPLLSGYTVRQYLLESILHPNAYTVEGYNANLMPTNFGNRLDLQQLADLIAYLESQDQ